MEGSVSGPEKEKEANPAAPGTRVATTGPGAIDDPKSTPDLPFLSRPKGRRMVFGAFKTGTAFKWNWSGFSIGGSGGVHWRGHDP